MRWKNRDVAAFLTGCLLGSCETGSTVAQCDLGFARGWKNSLFNPRLGLCFLSLSKRKPATQRACDYTTSQPLGCLRATKGLHNVRDQMYENRWGKNIPFCLTLSYSLYYILCTHFHALCPLFPLTYCILTSSVSLALGKSVMLLYGKSQRDSKEVKEGHRSQVSNRCKFQWCLHAFGHCCVSVNLGQVARSRW